MNLPDFSVIAPLVAAATLSVLVGLWVQRRCRTPGSGAFTLLMLSISLWSLAYALEIAANDLPTKLLWAKIAYLGIVTTPVAWLIFAIHYTGRGEWLRHRTLALLMVEPLATLALAWSNEAHSLVWSSVRLETQDLFLMLRVAHGPWFWVHVVYAYLAILVGAVLLVRTLTRSQHPYRMQAASLMLAVVAPWLGNVLYVFKLSPIVSLDLTPFGFTISGLALAWNISRLRFLDLFPGVIPVARDTIFESISEAIIVLDEHDRIVDLNPVASDILGQPMGTVLGQAAAHALKSWPQVSASLGARGDSTIEFTLGEGAHTRHYDLRILPLRHWRGHPAGRLLVFQDITEDKLKVERLRQSEERLRMALASAGMVIWDVDLRTGTAVRPEEPEPFSSLPPGSFPRAYQAFLDRVHPEDRAMVEQAIAQSIEQDVDYAMEFRVVKLDGAVRWIAGRGRVLRDGDGCPLRMMGTAMDITDRKRAEEERVRLSAEVEREHATLAAVMSSMSDGLLVMDLDRRIRYVNARASALVGVDFSRFIGQEADTAFGVVGQSLEDPDESSAGLRQALTHVGERMSFDLALVHPFRRHVLVEYFPVADDLGKHLGHGLVLRDVTAERELKQAQGEFISMVSHELRTPLASILGFAELMSCRQFTPEQIRLYSRIIWEEAQRFTYLIDDVLVLQRMEAGRVKYDLQPFPLDAVIHETLQVFAGQSSIHALVADVPDDIPFVRGDRNRVKQVLANLLSNAIKYSPKGKEVRVEVRQEGEMVAVTVRDQGLGIPPEAMPRLFERFYRVSGEDRQEIGGTGLGLAIARNIIEAHGGNIWVDSPGRGQGSAFSFTLPITTRDEVTNSVADEQFVGIPLSGNDRQ